MYITLTWMPAFATLPLCGALPMRAQCCSLPAPMSIYNRRRLPAPGKYGTFPLRAQCCSLPAPMSIYNRRRLPAPGKYGALPMRAQCCSLPAPMSIYNRRRLPAPGKCGAWVAQKSRSDRDRRERDPPNRGCRGLGWVQSFEERCLRVTQSPFWVTLTILLG